jgi:hypothetical protein
MMEHVSKQKLRLLPCSSPTHADFEETVNRPVSIRDGLIYPDTNVLSQMCSTGIIEHSSIQDYAEEIAWLRKSPSR